MGEVTGIGEQGQVRAAIAHAAAATGVDFDYLLAQAKLESSLDPGAQAHTSSAAGLYQFIGSTWLDTLDRHGEAHGLGWAGRAISRSPGGAPTVDPALRAQIMALRFDPSIAATMAGELANDNRATLSAALGREPDSSELYLAHLMGADGAKDFLSALDGDPAQAAAPLFPQAAAANHAIFYAAGVPRSLGQVMGLLRGKLSSAMEGQPAPAASIADTTVAAGPPLGPIAQQFHARAAPFAAGVAARPVMMADTLDSMFALRGGAAASAPAGVRNAYARFRALEL